MTKREVHRRKLEAERKAAIEERKLAKAKAKLEAAEASIAEKKKANEEAKAKLDEVKPQVTRGVKKGSTKPAGSGRKAGTPNLITRDVKEMIITALNNVGGADYLTLQAKKNPVAFMTLLGKIIPKDVSVTSRDNQIDFSIHDAELTKDELKEELAKRGLPTSVFIDEQVTVLMSKGPSGKAHVDVPKSRH